MHLNLKKSMALVVLAAGAASASAADVSVTASFSDLTIGTYGTIYGSYNTIQVDGVNNVLCAGVDEPNGCRTLRLDSQNPTRSYATAGGASVHFGFGNVFSPENVFSFTGATSNVLGTGPANTFKLGTFTYTNGSFYDLSYLDFKLTTNSSDAAYNQSYSGRIRLDVRSQYGLDPAQEADTFTVMGLAGPSVVSVYEQGACPAGMTVCNTGSVDVYGYINSLHLDHLANPTGGVASISAVPEPETYALMLAGLGMMGAVARKRSNKQA